MNYFLLFLGEVLSICKNPSKIKCDPAARPIQLHLGYHPHLDAFWIITFDAYKNQDPKSPHYYETMNVLHSNYGSFVSQIFNKQVQIQTEILKQNTGYLNRTFFFSEMCFFKYYYDKSNQTVRSIINRSLASGNWEILGGSWTQADQASNYFQDLIENIQVGRRFLYQSFGYHPNVSVSSDSFGHSSTLAYLWTLAGINGIILERSDQHLVNQAHKLQFTWNISSESGRFGLIATFVRWAIHGHQDVFNSLTGHCQDQNLRQIMNIGTQLQYFHEIYSNQNILRYFGHDFQLFSQNHFKVFDIMIDFFKDHTCYQTIPFFSNPTLLFKEYLKNLSALNVTRNQDVMPIWDYDSSLFWTGYFTTNPWFKFQIRKFSRLLQIFKKATVLDSSAQAQNLTEQAQQANSLQTHHDGITGTSKYDVHDYYFNQLQNLTKRVNSFLKNKGFHCNLSSLCRIPPFQKQTILSIYNPGTAFKNRLIKLQVGPGLNVKVKEANSQTICPCNHSQCNCHLYFRANLTSGSNNFLIQKSQQANSVYLNVTQDQQLKINQQGKLEFKYQDRRYLISIVDISSSSKSKSYLRFTRYGTTQQFSPFPRPGKYAVVNDPKTENVYSKFNKLRMARSKSLLYGWVQMNQREAYAQLLFDRESKALRINIYLSAHTNRILQYYLKIQSEIKSQSSFYTDSNGLLVLKRTINFHQDYQSFKGQNGSELFNANTYPATAFVYIKDQRNKLSVVVDRAQGVISPQSGVLYLSMDRVTEDDGKWVYQQSYRNQYMRHEYIMLMSQPNQFPERIAQRQFDQPLLFSFDKQIKEQKKNQFRQHSHLKFMVRNYGPKEVLLRITNIHDKANQTLELRRGDSIPILTELTGQQFNVKGLKQTDISGTREYGQMLKNKWKWDNKFQQGKQDMSIFNKILKDQIQLRPHEIRTFKLYREQLISHKKQVFSYKGLQHNELRLGFSRWTGREEKCGEILMDERSAMDEYK